MPQLALGGIPLCGDHASYGCGPFCPPLQQQPGGTMPKLAPKPLAEVILDEFVIESAIAPEFMGTAIKILPLLEVDPTTKEVLSTPIHDVMGWKFTRFVREIGPEQLAAQFLNEDGTTWQIKLFTRGKNGKRTGDYYAPKLAGNRAYLPPVPPEIRRKIGDRHGVDVPMDGSFWQWFEKHPEIPLIVTEDGKKDLSAMSDGHVVLALYGCTCGRSPDLHRMRDRN